MHRYSILCSYKNQSYSSGKLVTHNLSSFWKVSVHTSRKRLTIMMHHKNGEEALQSL